MIASTIAAFLTLYDDISDSISTDAEGFDLLDVAGLGLAMSASVCNASFFVLLNVVPNTITNEEINFLQLGSPGIVALIVASATDDW